MKTTPLGWWADLPMFRFLIVFRASPKVEQRRSCGRITKFWIIYDSKENEKYPTTNDLSFFRSELFAHRKTGITQQQRTRERRSHRVDWPRGDTFAELTNVFLWELITNVIELVQLIFDGCYYSFSVVRLLDFFLYVYCALLLAVECESINASSASVDDDYTLPSLAICAIRPVDRMSTLMQVNISWTHSTAIACIIQFFPSLRDVSSFHS